MRFRIVADGGSRRKENAWIGYGSFLLEPLDPDSPLDEVVLARLGPWNGVTSNQAEYIALLQALTHLEGELGGLGIDTSTCEIEALTDSQLVVGQMKMGWKVNSKKLQELNRGLRMVAGSFKEFSLKKVPRDDIVAVLGH